MPPHNDKEKFLQNILSYIKLPFERKAIYKELDNHIDDRIHEFIEEGLTPEHALIKAIDAMGNPADIGKELNQVHRPLLGWLWKISDILMKILAIIVALNLLTLIISSINLNPALEYIDKETIVYHLKVDEKAKIDNLIINITDLIYDTDGTMHIFFKTYSDSIFINTWSFSNIGIISDEFGNEYYGGSGSSGGFIRYHNIQVDDFDESSNSLNILYDYYNRHYAFHFDLPTGEEHE